MKPNIGRIVSILVACVMLGAPVLAGGVVARKPGPMPPPEPTGNLAVTSETEIVTWGSDYVRLYDWDSANNKFKHTWSGTMGSNWAGNAAIGDLDDDGVKEIVASGDKNTGTKKAPVHSRFMKIWWAGDQSDSPTLSLDVGSNRMDVCDIDRDGQNEFLSLAGGDIRVWKVTKTGYTVEATVDVGEHVFYDMAEADADNDGDLEILVGQYGDEYIGAVIEYDATDGYSVALEISPDDRGGLITELSVGDVDGDSENEVFGTGHMDSNIYLWKYDSASNTYKQIWTIQETSDDMEISNEIADVDGCGICEFMHTQSFDQNLVLYKYDRDSGTFYNVGSYYGSPGGVADEISSHDWDGDGAAELVDDSRIWDWDGSKMTIVQMLNGGGIPAIG